MTTSASQNDDHPGSDKPVKRPEKRSRGLMWALVFGGILAFLCLNPFSGILLSVFRIRVTETKLRDPNVYKPVAKSLALYCQSDQKLLPKYLSYAWLPAQLAAIGHGDARIGNDYAMVEMGGGFHHFGYRLVKHDPPQNLASNVWDLYLYSEGSPNVLLTTIVTAPNKHLSADELHKLATAGFDNILERNPKDSGAFLGKILLHLRFGDFPEAARTCRTWTNVAREAWLPQFTYAHVRCRLGEYDAASADFGNWVAKHPNFATYNYLALFQFREGKTNEALTAVEMTLKRPFVEPPGTDGNKFYLGYNGAMIAFIAGKYDLCLAVCDKMLADAAREPSWKRSTCRLRAAGMYMKGDQSAAAESMKLARSSMPDDPFISPEMKVSDDKLSSALQRKDTLFIRDAVNWVDDYDSWFSPFDTDETGIHGTKDVPSPYPKNWNSDRVRPER